MRNIKAKYCAVSRLIRRFLLLRCRLRSSVPGRGYVRFLQFIHEPRVFLGVVSLGSQFIKGRQVTYGLTVHPVCPVYRSPSQSPAYALSRRVMRVQCLAVQAFIDILQWHQTGGASKQHKKAYQTCSRNPFISPMLLTTRDIEVRTILRPRKGWCLLCLAHRLFRTSVSVQRCTEEYEECVFLARVRAS